MKFSEFKYERPNIDELKKQFDTMINTFNEAKDFETQNQIMENINNLRNTISTMASIASVRYSINQNDKFYDEENTFYDQNNPAIQEMSTKYYKALKDSKFRDELEKKWGSLIFKIADLEIKTFSHEIIEDLKKENELVTSYNKLTGSAKIMFEGEERNLAGMVPFTRKPDRNIRKQATEAVYKFFQDNSEELDTIYDNLVKIRTEIAKKLGYKNFIELAYDRLTRTDYNADMVANYRKQIRENVVPIAEKLHERQAKRLGLEKLMIYDEGFNFKTGNADPEGTPEEIIENAKNMYKELSNETGEFFNFMTESQLMDLEAKPGKRPGGYCTYFPDYKAPFIFSNFNGTKDDIVVLTHEAGHAFQSYMSRSWELPEYQWPTLEACEIHSMSMEFFTWPWMKNFFGDKTEKFKFTHLSDAISFLPYGAAVDEFQHFVYGNPEATPEERKKKWSEIEKTYMPHRDNAGIEFLENGGVWQRQLHIYCVPFYYIDYTLAQICALQFWKKNIEDSEAAWGDYLALCKAGGSQSFTGLVKLANLKIPFEDGCLDGVMDTVSDYLDKVDDTKF